MLSQGKKNALEKSLENVLMPLLGKQVFFFFFFPILSVKPLPENIDFFFPRTVQCCCCCCFKC